MQRPKKSLRWLNFQLLRLFRLSQRNKKLTLLLAFLLLVGSSLGLPKSKQVINIDELITPEFETYESLSTLGKSFQQANNVILTISSAVPWTEVELCALESIVKKVDLSIATLERIDSPLALRMTKGEKDALHFPHLVPLNCLSPGASLVNFGALEQSPWNSLLWNATDNALTFEFTVSSPLEIESVRTLRRQFEFDFHAAIKKEITLHWGGSAVFQDALKEGYKISDSLNLFLCLAMILVFKLLYNTWRSSLLFFSTLIPVTLILHGIAGHLSWPVDFLLNAMFIILLVACVEDFVFLAGSQFDRPKAHWRTHFRALILPSFLTSFTTCLGFGSLDVSELSTINRFGFLTALGAMLEWVALMIVLPSAIGLCPTLQTWAIPKQKKGNPLVGSFLKSMALFTPRRSTGFALVLVALLGLAFLPYLNIDDSPLQLFPESHSLRKVEKYLRESRGFIVEASIIFEDKKDLAFQRKVLEEIKQNPHVKLIDSPVKIFDFLTQSEARPERKDLIWWSAQEHPSMNRYFGDPEGDRKQSRSVIYLDTDRVDDINALRKKVSSLCENRCSLGGSLVSYAEFGEKVPAFLIESLFLSTFLVGFVLMILAFIQGERLLPLLISSFWGPMILIFLLGISQVQIYFVTTIFASVLVGITGDNAIQFLFNREADGMKEGIDLKANASILLTLLLVLVSCLFIFSPFVPVRALGVIFAVGAIFSFVGDVLILRCFSQELPPKK